MALAVVSVMEALASVASRVMPLSPSKSRAPSVASMATVPVAEAISMPVAASISIFKVVEFRVNLSAAVTAASSAELMVMLPAVALAVVSVIPALASVASIVTPLSPSKSRAPSTASIPTVPVAEAIAIPVFALTAILVSASISMS